MFGSNSSPNTVSFKYDGNKQKQTNIKTPQFAFSCQIQLFYFNSTTNENVSYGNAGIVIKPNLPSYQLIIYQNQTNPLLNIQVTSSVKWILKEKIYVYITDPHNSTWTLQFPDPQSAAKASITFSSIFDKLNGSKLYSYDLMIGNGQSVKVGDTVNVSYIGLLGLTLPIVETIFDQKEEYSFIIGSDKTIKGWSLGVEGMKIGGSRVLIIPPELAYGNNSIGNVIPSNAILTFLITLKSVQFQNIENLNKKIPEIKPIENKLPIQENNNKNLSEKMKKMGAIQMPFMPSNISNEQNLSDQSTNEIKSKHSKQLFDNFDLSDLSISEDNNKNNNELNQKEIINTINETEILNRMDILSNILETKYENLLKSTNESISDFDLCDEIIQLSNELDNKNDQIKDLKKQLEDLSSIKSNSKLKTELDYANSELESLKSILKNTKNLRQEIDDLKNENKKLKEIDLIQLESQVSKLKLEQSLINKSFQEKFQIRSKELISSFMCNALNEINTKFLQNNHFNGKQVCEILYDIFHKSSDPVFNEIDTIGFQ